MSNKNFKSELPLIFEFPALFNSPLLWFSRVTKMEPNSEQMEPQSAKKAKYCDKAFKKQLMKALRVNFGEPNNMDKIRG